MTDNPQYDRVTCYFCLSEERHILEEHHTVPRRFDGSDDDENLVRVCPTCHEKLERLYSERFYRELGVIGGGTDLSGLFVAPQPDSDGGAGVTQRDRVRSLLDIIDKLEDQSERGAPVGMVLQRAVESGIPAGKAVEELEKLCKTGEVYMPDRNYLRTT